MLFQFSLRLICGMSLVLSAMPRQRVASGFFRVQMLILLGLGVLAALSGNMPAAEAAANVSSVSTLAGLRVAGGIGIAAVAFLGSVLWTLERRRGGEMALMLIAAGSLALLAASPLLYVSDGSTSQWRPEFFVSELCSAVLLGAALTAMLLGHSYLTTPTMSIAPLSRVNAFFGGAAVARGVASGVALAVAWDRIVPPLHPMWLALRWLAGIVGPIVMFVMVHQILKYRNTQAATGVLFVGVILTFIGELTASLLFHDLQIPF